MISLPSGWALSTVPVLCEVLDSLRVPINSDERSQRLAKCRQEDLVPYFGATGQVGWIDAHLFDEDLVLLGEDGVPFLDQGKPKAYRVSGKSWVNNHAHVLRARKEAIDWRLLTAQLNTVNYTGYVTGSTRLKLTQGAMNKLPLLVPPRAEQQRIADKLDTVLTRVDAVNTRLARVAPILKRFRQSVLAAATSGRLTGDWRDANKAAAWTPRTVESLCLHISDGPFGSNLKSDDYTDAGARVVRLENIGHLNFDAAKETFISLDKYETLKKHTLLPGDLLFSSFVDEEVRVCEFPTDIDEPTINKADCFCVRVDKAQVVARFLAFRLACKSTYQALKDLVHGATRPRINLRQLRGFEVMLPTADEQAEIVRRVETLFAFADRLEARLQTAQTATERLTPALLAKAFRGELVPQDPNDEPASELLKRLAATASASAPKRGRRKVEDAEA